MSQLQLNKVSKEIIRHAEEALVPEKGLPRVVDDYFIQRLKQDEMQQAQVDPRLYEGLRKMVKAEVVPLYEQFRKDTWPVRERRQKRKVWQFVLGTVGVCEVLEAMLTRGRSIAPQIFIPTAILYSLKRVAKQDEARDKFNEFLIPHGLQVEHVLIRYPQYHEAVQARIEARNIQEQTKQKNMEEAKLAEALGALKEVEKQGEANLSIKLMEGSNYVTRLTAQMDSYRRKKASEANRVMALAEAEKQRMVNDAYQGAGADKLVGLQWAKVLSGLDTIVLESGGPNGFNPLDLDKLMKQLKVNQPQKETK